ncbi:non-structural maintenance of chromosomes element 4 [Acrasis kona]|uniref:Non-structural maintenance of chromosomes element 4 n=1 Tax=Acrasis kona TaxID=1008807 RepID=A0AAW2YWX8_9EUKA
MQQLLPNTRTGLHYINDRNHGQSNHPMVVEARTQHEESDLEEEELSQTSVDENSLQRNNVSNVSNRQQHLGDAKHKSDDDDSRRQLRGKILKLTRRMDATLTEPGEEQLLIKMKKGNKLFQNVRRAREGVLDAQWLTMASQLSVMQCQKIHQEDVVDPKKFINLLYLKYKKDGEEQFDWLALGKDVINKFCRTNTPNFMNGAVHIDVVKKTRRKAVRKSTTNTATMVQPESIKDQQITDDPTTRSLEALFKNVSKTIKTSNADKSFLGCVVDRQSFTKTIENIFNLSFLVKDGRVSLQNKEQELTLGLVNKQLRNNTEHQTKKQSILKMNLSLYQKMISNHADGPQQNNNQI